MGKKKSASKRRKGGFLGSLPPVVALVVVAPAILLMFSKSGALQRFQGAWNGAPPPSKHAHKPELHKKHAVEEKRKKPLDSWLADGLRAETQMQRESVVKAEEVANVDEMVRAEVGAMGGVSTSQDPPPPPPPQPAVPSEHIDCEDLDPSCSFWKSIGECEVC